MTIGEKIRNSRINAGLTQKELGSKMGVDSATVGKYERGTLNPKLQTLEKIAAALGVTVWELGVVESPEYRKIVISRQASKYRECGKENSRLQELETEFRKLNLTGQEKALERIRELTEIPRYSKELTPPDEMIWCGPSIPGLMEQYAMFTGNLPKDVESFLSEHPGTGALFASVENLCELRAKLDRNYEAGEIVPREKTLYDSLKNELGTCSVNEEYEYRMGQSCHFALMVGDTPKDTPPKND